jgi:hypothetical protein
MNDLMETWLFLHFLVYLCNVCIFIKKIGRCNFLSNYVEFKFIYLLLHQMFFALQAIYRYLIVMKNVKIGYMRLAFFFVWEI